MRHPLTSMLYLTILIVKGVLLVGTRALTEVPIDTIRNSTQSNPQQAAGNNLPKQSSNEEPACYHCVGLHYITNCAKYQQDSIRIV